jgi:signal transduction histidine kinase
VFKLIRKYWIALVVPFFLVLCFFLFLYSGIRKTFIEEIRDSARFTAVCTASEVDPADVGRIKGPEDVSCEAYIKLQKILLKFRKSAENVRYVYIMRRSSSSDAKPSDYEYVVDLPVEDENKNGIIEETEKSELPGKRYDASKFPAMINAWNVPDADMEPSPDPPYPDTLSGYAPIKNADGKTIAIVGADITDSAIARELFAIRVLIISFGVIMAWLVSTIIFFYCGRREALNKIQDINAELQKKNNRLEEDVVLRNDLSSMIVHDMRNSMGVLSAYNELMGSLIEALPEPVRKEGRDIRETMVTTIDQTTGFLQDMLVLAKSESGKLMPHLDVVDIKSLLLESIKHCEVVAKPSGVLIEKVVPDESVNLSADKHLLLRVFDNLLLNAIKHSPSSGQVKVSLQKRDIDKTSVRIIVADEGEGVDPDLRAHLFEKFSAGDKSAITTKSIGLGLAFCKMAVEVHKGRIYLEDSKKGSVFVVELQ